MILKVLQGLVDLLEVLNSGQFVSITMIVSEQVSICFGYTQKSHSIRKALLSIFTNCSSF